MHSDSLRVHDNSQKCVDDAAINIAYFHISAPQRPLTMALFQSKKQQSTLLLLAAILIGGAFSESTTLPEECKNFAPPAVIKGNKIFVSSTGQYLPIKGINYYPRPNAGDLVLGNSQDFYTEAFRSSWERDIEQFKALRVNAIRLYAVDPGLNHDAFMCALKAAGIYVMVGLAADCENCAVQVRAVLSACAQVSVMSPC